MINVLVTGVGAIIGYGIIHSLRKSKYETRIVGMDIYHDAVGQVWCDKFIQAILANDEGYITFLRSIIEENNIDIVFFGTEQEIARVNRAREELADIMDKFVINCPEVFDISEDKWLTHCFLTEHGFPTIDSYIEGSYEELSKKLGRKMILKPRRSYASKGIAYVDNRVDFDYWKNRQADQFMAQRIVGSTDEEYTSAAFGFGDGSCSPVITMKRKLSSEGSTAKAEVMEVPEIDAYVRKLVAVLKPIGPTNFQFRKDGERYLLLETNPRISSSTSLRAAFGYNEAEMAISFFVEKKRVTEVEVKKGHAVRYISDWVWVEP